jgi:hypothetical protein
MQEPLLARVGASPANHRNNPSPWKPVFISKCLTGLWTQRNVLHEPADVVSSRFYGGRPDALWDSGAPGTLSKNVELTNELTLARRFGTSAFSTYSYSNPPLSAFSLETPEGIQVIIDTDDGVYYDEQNGSAVLLWTKKVGAGPTRFVGVDGILYAGDGVSNWVYTAGNGNATPPVWNYGIAAPTVAPTVSITEEAEAGLTWTASTVFSTMGLIVDANNNIQFLISVDATGGTSNFGTTGQGQPNWNNTFGGTTTESSGTPIVWQSYGQIFQWTQGAYANQAAIYDPVTNCIFSNYTPGGGTTGTQPPKFNAVPGSFTQDGTVKWGNNGRVGMIGTDFGMYLWQPSTPYDKFDTGGANPMFIVEPVLPNATNTLATTTQAVYVQGATNNGTSGSNYSPAWATITGLITTDNELQWVCLGTKTWAANTKYTAWKAGVHTFSVVIDGNSPTNFWVCTQSGTSSSSVTWPTGPNYGDQHQDGSVVWTCVGPTMTWVKNTQWCMPSQGFSAPSSEQAYGGAGIFVNNLSGIFSMFPVVSGKSGTVIPPDWVETVGGQTVDNAVTWVCVGDYSQFSISWFTGHNWAYSYKAREVNDPYVTTSLLTFGGLNTQAALLPLTQNVSGLDKPLGPYLGSGTGAVSTASPATGVTGSNTGAVCKISGPYSPDPQCDTIVLWRDADGGGTSNMFELVEIPNIPSLAGVSNWSFNDFLPDIASATDGINFPGLDELSQAPINGTNDPPLAGFLPMSFGFNRIWGSVGNTVYISGGPDVITGNPNFAYYEADNFPFLATVVRIVQTPQGQVVFLNDGIDIIAGGPATASFYSVPLVPGLGLGNFNGLDQFAGEIAFFSSDSQLRVMSPSLNVSNIGFAIGNMLATFNSSLTYVTYHNNGTDSAIYVGDGMTGYFRLNPYQVPGYASGPEPIWSPFAEIVGGCGMLQSVETSAGIKSLLIGPTGDISSDTTIGKRDLTVFTDQGQEFDAYFTMGAITLASPGQISILKFLECDFSGEAFRPTVSYLLDELSGSFTTFTLAPISDPPSLYGPNGHPLSWSPNRYWFAGTGSLARCRNIQIHVDFGMTSNPDAMFATTLYGKYVVE